jgi:hypothetical protein
MKLRIAFSIALLWCAAAVALAQVGTPKLGMARYADRTVHPVYGLESNLLIDDQLLSEADAISFSDAGGLIAIAGRIQLIRPDGTVLAEYDSGEAHPVLNVDGALTTAIAWLPSRGAIVHWNGAALVETELGSAGLPGRVTSIQAADVASAKLLVNDASGNVFEVRVSVETAQVISVDLLPGVKGSAFQQQSFVVFADAGGLHIQPPGGVIRTLPLAATDLVFERMSSDWVHIASASTGQDWVLHLNATALQLSQLPAPRVSKRLVARPVRPQGVAR